LYTKRKTARAVVVSLVGLFFFTASPPHFLFHHIIINIIITIIAHHQLKGLDGACTTTLQYLNLENNTLNGSIPSVLPSMTALQWALFGHNAFSGFLPALPSSASKYSFWGADTVRKMKEFLK
jgi:hypothetical protein